MNRFLLVLLLLLLPFGAYAQEEVDADEVERSEEPIPAKVTRAVRAHKTPSGETTAVLDAGTEVEVVGMNPNGWVRVRSGDKKKGWVDRHFLAAAEPDQPEIAPKTFVRKKKSGSNKCFPDLGDCPPFGCSEEGSEHAIFNEVKHGPPTGRTTPVTLATFTRLQKAADDVVGQGADLTAEDRDMIKDLSIGGKTLGEGHSVSVVGYIVGKPHPNKGESVNCNLTGVANNDFHISIGSNPNRTEFESIVVEMIPQDRNEGWTNPALNKVAKARQKVMVVGQLFYDNAHRVNANPDRVLGGEPKRVSIWEIHPVTEFYVCVDPPCAPGKKSDWVSLEDVD